MKANIRQWPFVLLGFLAILVGGGVIIINSLVWYWAVVIFIIAFASFAIVGSKQERRRIEAHLAGRPIPGEKEFGKHFFSDDRTDIAAKLRKVLVKYVGIDISRMNPTDRLIEDLLMDDFDSMSTVEYVSEIEKEFGIEIPDSAAEKLTTFQSVVDFVAEAVKSKAN